MVPLDYELSEGCEQTTHEYCSVLGPPGCSQVLERADSCEEEPFRRENLCLCGFGRPDGSAVVVERE